MKRSRFQTARRLLIFWTLFIGIGAVAGAAGLLLAKKRTGVILGGIFGVTLMLWICIQFYIFPFNIMSTLYFIFGFCQAATGYAAWVFEKQEAFHVDIRDYPHIGAQPKKLVVFFSRMGYVKKYLWNRKGGRKRADCNPGKSKKNATTG